jgi:hypothetical protein
VGRINLAYAEKPLICWFEKRTADDKIALSITRVESSGKLGGLLGSADMHMGVLGCFPTYQKCAY